MKKILFVILLLLLTFTVGCSKADAEKKTENSAPETTQNENGDTEESGINANRTDDGKYILELTEEQEASFAEAVCHVICKVGEEKYFPVMTDIGVTKEENRLISDFDGNMFYVETGFGERFTPILHLNEKTDEYTKFSIPYYAKNDSSSKQVCYHAAINNASGEMEVFAFTEAWDITLSELLSGEYTEADISDYIWHDFTTRNMYYTMRNEDKSLKTTDLWEIENYYYICELPTSEGCELVYAPVSDEDMYVIFEIKNKDGSGYCSEPASIENVDHILSYPEEKPVSVKWDSGESVYLGEYGGVEITLKTAEDLLDRKKYTLSCKNNNDYKVKVDISDIFVNGNIYCEDHTLQIYYIDPGATEETSAWGATFGSAEEAGAIGRLDLLKFSVTVTDSSYKRTVFAQPITVEIDENIISGVGFVPASIDWPVRGMLAEPDQVLYDKDGVKITLMAMGGELGDSSGIKLMLKMENTTEDEKYFSVNQLSLDGVALELNTFGSTKTLKPGSVSYDFIEYAARELDELGIYSIEKASLLLRFSKYKGGEFSSFEKCDVALSEYGTAQSFREGDTVIFEEKGVRISVLGFTNDDDYYEWKLAIVNESDEDYTLKAYDSLQDTESKLISISDSNSVCSGEKTVARIYTYSTEELKDLSIKIMLLDLNLEKIIYKSENTVVLAEDGAYTE